MDSFFIDPSTLPGGEKWVKACKELQGNATANADILRKSLQCDASKLGGFIQVISLLLVYGAILYTVRLTT